MSLRSVQHSMKSLSSDPAKVDRSCAALRRCCTAALLHYCTGVEKYQLGMSTLYQKNHKTQILIENNIILLP